VRCPLETNRLPDRGEQGLQLKAYATLAGELSVWYGQNVSVKLPTLRVRALALNSQCDRLG